MWRSQLFAWIYGGGLHKVEPREHAEIRAASLVKMPKGNWFLLLTVLAYCLADAASPKMPLATLATIKYSNQKRKLQRRRLLPRAQHDDAKPAALAWARKEDSASDR